MRAGRMIAPPLLFQELDSGRFVRAGDWKLRDYLVVFGRAVLNLCHGLLPITYGKHYTYINTLRQGKCLRLRLQTVAFLYMFRIYMKTKGIARIWSSETRKK